MRTILIPCETSEGMFPNEVAVTVHSASGKARTFFADRELIEERDERCYLRVTVVRETEGEIVVLLPTESYENGSRWLKPNESELVEA